jgi:hypothetical protein
VLGVSTQLAEQRVEVARLIVACAEPASTVIVKDNREGPDTDLDTPPGPVTVMDILEQPLKTRSTDILPPEVENAAVSRLSRDCRVPEIAAVLAAARRTRVARCRVTCPIDVIIPTPEARSTVWERSRTADAGCARGTDAISTAPTPTPTAQDEYLMTAESAARPYMPRRSPGS